MHKEFWHERWRTGQIGFHRNEPHWALPAHWHELALPEDAPVLVPLCGKSLDMRWLRDRGHPVEGIELDPLAIQAFFDDWRSDSALEMTPSNMASCSAANGVRLWQMDFFDFLPEKRLTAFYDRAALIALPSALRPAYLQHLRRCLQTGAVGLLVCMEYDQNQKSGPPFSVPFEEISGQSNFSVSLLQRRDILSDSPKFQDRGISSLYETVYRLQAV